MNFEFNIQDPIYPYLKGPYQMEYIPLDPEEPKLFYRTPHAGLWLMTYEKHYVACLTQKADKTWRVVVSSGYFAALSSLAIEQSLNNLPQPPIKLCQI